MKRLLWVFIFALIFLAALVNFLLYAYHLRGTFNERRERLMLVASNAALSISADELLDVRLEQSAEASPEYEVVYQKLTKIKKANPAIKYVYIMTATNEPGILQYVVDADPIPQIVTAHCPTSLPGDRYDARALPAMMNAYKGPSADKRITTDAWGVFISGYAPVRDAGGKPIAILGVDSDAISIQAMEKSVKAAGLAALCTGFLFLISFVTLIRFT